MLTSSDEFLSFCYAHKERCVSYLIWRQGIPIDDAYDVFQEMVFYLYRRSKEYENVCMGTLVYHLRVFAGHYRCYHSAAKRGGLGRIDGNKSRLLRRQKREKVIFNSLEAMLDVEWDVADTGGIWSVEDMVIVREFVSSLPLNKRLNVVLDGYTPDYFYLSRYDTGKGVVVKPKDGK